MTDVLDEDSVKVAGQKFAIISIVPPENAESNKMAIKIKGVFEYHDEAVKWCDRISKMEPMFNTYIVDMYKWLLLPPDNSKIDNQVYIDEELNNLIQAHKKEQDIAKQAFTERLQEQV